MEPNVCRCCLTGACYKDLSNEYYYAGHKEVYSQMLLDTFNITITDSSYKRLICEECIAKLRAAAAFKKQVTDAEETLKSSLLIKTNGEDIVEPKEEFDCHFDDHISNHSGFEETDIEEKVNWGHQKTEQKSDEGDIFVIKMESEETEDGKEKESKKKQPLKKTSSAKNGKPVSSTGKQKTSRTKSVASWKHIEQFFELDNSNPHFVFAPKLSKRHIQPNGKEKMRVKLATQIFSHSVAMGIYSKASTSKRTDDEDNEDSETLRKLIENSLKLVLNSNLCLFESLRTAYKCFSCKENFINIADLRQHTKTHSNIKLLKNRFNSLRGKTYRNADISNLSCNICSEKCTELNNLKEHLVTHDIKFSDCGHFLVPYKLEKDFKCVLCDQEFQTFTRLSIHMNCHYTNNVCEICGVSFISRLSLRSHLSQVHKEKKCTLCSATFPNNYTRIKHMRKSHKTNESRRFCRLCNKTFRYSYLLFEHQVKEHGAKRQVCICTECGKSFLHPNNLKVHVRSVHIRERRYPCSVCRMAFFTKCDQKRHERTHEDVRSFSCEYCEGRFKSKDSWRRHVKRQHGHLYDCNKDV